MHHLESSFWVPADIDTVWSLAARPKTLAKISPANLSVHVDFDGEAYEGLELTIKFRPQPLPFAIEWVSQIQNVVSQGDARQFEDIQKHGPFAFWQHTHKFIKGTRDVESAAGQTLRSLNPGTWIVDSVEYKMPLGLLGSVAHAIAVEKILRNMFRDRKKAFSEMFAK